MAIPAVTLRSTTEADLPFVRAAEQATENAQFIRQWSQQRHLIACNHPDERHWIITDTANGQAVGYSIFLGIQDPDQTILLKRIVITAKGHGYGRAALKQLIAKAFNDFQANRLWLDVMTTNARARHLYESLGFVEEGCLREAVKTPNGFASAWVMAILKSEFYGTITA
ncbi:MAG: GNAT family protein [Cyanobacteria bacterium]|nr:GNAT family protein [Cyanobacteriota bacterium]MDA0865509.1 GNAT family protein [Cyanobacteriota bacterium]